MTSTPEDDRPVEIEEIEEGEGVSTGAADEAAARDAELHAEEPLALEEEQLRPEGPPEDVTP